MTLDETIQKPERKDRIDHFSLRSLFKDIIPASAVGALYTTPFVYDYYNPLGAGEETSQFVDALSFVTGFTLYLGLVKGVPAAYRIVRREIDSYRKNKCD